MRNALRGYDIQFGEPGNEMMARWDDIEAVYKLDSSKMQQLQLMPKITDDHINLTLGKKMSVRLAANVLSRSMAQCIRTYRMYGEIASLTAEGTAQFCEQVKWMFNLCNNNNFFDGINAQNLDDKVAELRYCITWLRSLKLFKHQDNSTNTSRVPSNWHHFMDAWQISLGSFISLACKLISENHVQCLLTRQLTQDHVETGFSCIR